MFFINILSLLIHWPEMYQLSVYYTCFCRACLEIHHAGYVQTDLPAAQSEHVTSQQPVCLLHLHAHGTAGQCSKASASPPPPLSLTSLPGVIQGYAVQLLVACPCRAENQMACSPAGLLVSNEFQTRLSGMITSWSTGHVPSLFVLNGTT